MLSEIPVAQAAAVLVMSQGWFQYKIGKNGSIKKIKFWSEYNFILYAVLLDLETNEKFSIKGNKDNNEKT